MPAPTWATSRWRRRSTGPGGGRPGTRSTWSGTRRSARRGEAPCGPYPGPWLAETRAGPATCGCGAGASFWSETGLGAGRGPAEGGGGDARARVGHGRLHRQRQDVDLGLLRVVRPRRARPELGGAGELAHQVAVDAGARLAARPAVHRGGLDVRRLRGHPAGRITVGVEAVPRGRGGRQQPHGRHVAVGDVAEEPVIDEEVAVHPVAVRWEVAQRRGNLNAALAVRPRRGRLGVREVVRDHAPRAVVDDQVADYRVVGAAGDLHARADGPGEPGGRHVRVVVVRDHVVLEEEAG